MVPLLKNIASIKSLLPTKEEALSIRLLHVIPWQGVSPHMPKYSIRCGRSNVNTKLHPFESRKNSTSTKNFDLASVARAKDPSVINFPPVDRSVPYLIKLKFRPFKCNYLVLHSVSVSYKWLHQKFKLSVVLSHGL